QVGIEQIERARRVVPVAAVQNQYNLSAREFEDVVDYCAGEGIVFVPYFPLRGDGGPALAQIAERHGATPEQIALAWLLGRSPAGARAPTSRAAARRSGPSCAAPLRPRGVRSSCCTVAAGSRPSTTAWWRSSRASASRRSTSTTSGRRRRRGPRASATRAHA